ncbi:MAG: RNA polymerase sigma factor [Phycisphaerales bacterium JB040]
MSSTHVAARSSGAGGSDEPSAPGGGARGAALAGGPASALRGLSDERLAARSADGNREAFAELVRRYGDRVLGLTMSRLRLRADAEEAAQETFLRAWRGIRTFDSERRFAAWIMTIAHRQAVEVMRRRKRESDDRERRVTEARAREPGPEDAGPGVADGRVWAVARDVLKADAYEAVWLRYAEGCSPQEVARVMGKSGVWVRVTLHRSRSRLAEALGDLAGQTEGGAREEVA